MSFGVTTPILYGPRRTGLFPRFSQLPSMDTDPPSFLGRYQMVKVLGTGAMGVACEGWADT